MVVELLPRIIVATLIAAPERITKNVLRRMEFDVDLEMAAAPMQEGHGAHADADSAPGLPLFFAQVHQQLPGSLGVASGGFKPAQSEQRLAQDGLGPDSPGYLCGSREVDEGRLPGFTQVFSAAFRGGDEAAAAQPRGTAGSTRPPTSTPATSPPSRRR
ncbi:MAG: hypothetical protein R6X25_10860 [Candidatus Krumholzibacteriia bacterium]